MDSDDEALATHLGKNIKLLRDGRGFTQQQMSKLSGLPRATWANLESGTANPTLAVLHKVAVALQVTVEELISTPRAECQHYPLGALPTRVKSHVMVRRLLPDPIPGMEMERMELPPLARMSGVPHTPGTREYLTCESGEMVLHVAGEHWRLAAGDVVAFRGDQRHSYANPGRSPAVGYSVVLLTRIT